MELLRAKVFTALFLLGYFVFGLATSLAGDRMKEFPPFFNWFLFNQIPSEHSQIQYMGRVIASEDASFEDPLFFNRAHSIVIDAGSNRARDLFSRLGRALKSGDEREAKRLRQLIEDGYIRTGTTYEVVAITYDPIRRFQTGELEEVRVLAIFTK